MRFRYDQIRDEVLRRYQDELVLIALGPTATILAADFAEHGIQAIDIGHVDIEYEWFLQRAKNKTAVAGKYTNEVVDGRNVSACYEEEYLLQIVARIE